MRNRVLFFLLALLSTPLLRAQVLTKAQQLIRTGEDSLQTGFDESRTVLSGYGSAYFQRDAYYRRNKATLERVVLFVGHQFNRKFAFFSEMELENARVEGGEAKGELSMEQAYVRYNINADQYLVAGLFLPRIGLLNENHLPVNFNGVERPQVETWIIPSTWRELGVGWYGKLSRLPLQLSLALVTGLNSRDFVHGSGIREGAQGGALSTANNCALTAAVIYNWKALRLQVSGYAGGTTGENPRRADSLHLNSGAFGTPFYLGEADLTYSHQGFQAKALAVVTELPDVARINAAYARNNPERMVGSYLELGYDVLYQHNQRTDGGAQCVLFGRLEYLDLNSKIPEAPRGLPDATLDQRHLILGVNFMPIPSIAIKADVRLLHTGAQNKDLLINPSPNALPYSQRNSFLNVGIGYSF